MTTWRDDRGRLAALVPLSRIRTPVVRRFGWTVEVAATAGTGPGNADHTPWLVHPLAVEAVRTWAETAVGDRALLLRGVPADGTGPLPRDAQVLDEVHRPRLAIPADVDDPPVSADFRRTPWRDRHRLVGQGVTFSWVGPGALGPETLWTLRHLHLLRREALGPAADASAFHDGTVRLHAALASLGHANDNDDRDEIATTLSTIGYRYLLRDAQLPSAVDAGDALQVTMRWTNTGSSPAYPALGADPELRLRLVDGDGDVVHRTTVAADVATWLPDDEHRVDAALTVPDDLSGGAYGVEVGMRNARTGDALALPMAGTTADGWAPLGEVAVDGDGQAG